MNGKENSYAVIKINDEEIVSRKQSRRGINLVILNGEDHSVIHNKRYNTYKYVEASNQMVAAIKKVPKGSIIIAAVKDDAKKNLNYAARRVFMNMGGTNIWKIAYKQAWGFIGIKGMKKGIDKLGVSVEFGAIYSYVKKV